MATVEHLNIFPKDNVNTAIDGLSLGAITSQFPEVPSVKIKQAIAEAVAKGRLHIEYKNGIARYCPRESALRIAFNLLPIITDLS